MENPCGGLLFNEGKIKEQRKVVKVVEDRILQAEKVIIGQRQT